MYAREQIIWKIGASCVDHIICSRAYNQCPRGEVSLSRESFVSTSRDKVTLLVGGTVDRLWQDFFMKCGVCSGSLQFLLNLQYYEYGLKIEFTYMSQKHIIMQVMTNH